jgi:hypothetical protein
MGDLPKILEQTDLHKLYKKRTTSSFHIIIHIEKKEEEEATFPFSF